MATPTGTITLDDNLVIIETYKDSALSANGTLMLSKLIQKGSNVSMWNVNDIIVVSSSNAYGFQENSNPYFIISQEFIYFKYTAAPAP